MITWKTLKKLGEAVLYGNILGSIKTQDQIKIQLDAARELFKQNMGRVYEDTLPSVSEAEASEGDMCILIVDNEYTPYTVVDGAWVPYTTAEGTTTEADLSNYFTKTETNNAIADKLTNYPTKTGDNIFSGSNTFTGTLTATLTGNADTATSATKATKDSEGNVIKDTYATKTECSSKATLDATQMLAVNSGITATKVSEYEALKTSKANDSELSTVAKSGSYSDLLNKPTINDSTINVKVNGTSVGTFTTNNATSKDIAITVPTKMSDLDNDSDYIASPTLHDYALKTEVNAKQDSLTDTQLSAVNSGITSDKVATYDGYATSKANDSSVVHTTGNETINGTKTFNSSIIFAGRGISKGANTGYLEFNGGASWGNGGSIVLSGQERSSYPNSVLIATKTDTSTNILLYQNGEFKPNSNNSNDSALGTSSNKWKTINGINPGALSLPMSNGKVTDIAFTSGQGWKNTYFDGWLRVAEYTPGDNSLYVSNDSIGLGVRSVNVASVSNDGWNEIYIPVRRDDVVTCIHNINGSGIVGTLFKCLGNV